jgi:GNAT superfamily N-acetyltransferase
MSGISSSTYWKFLVDGDSSEPIGFIREKRSSTATTSIGESPQIFTVETATVADAPMVIDTIANAFLNDPTWSWAIPDPAKRRGLWKPYIDGALRYSWVYKTNGFETVSVWIPPQGTEFTEEDEERLPDLLTELVGSRAPDVAELFHRFNVAHPRNEPHYYLNLLGTRDEYRGRGLGMALLRENLARIDAERMPAYLESSNPSNNHRYELLGFVPISTFQAPGDGPVVTCMWRKGK